MTEERGLRWLENWRHNAISLLMAYWSHITHKSNDSCYMNDDRPMLAYGGGDDRARFETKLKGFSGGAHKRRQGSKHRCQGFDRVVVGKTKDRAVCFTDGSKALVGAWSKQQGC
ncbi:hypothetical protein V6N12_058454 [Hibiscus sabdariffa]|uniref:Uncharacterized protein n=1 Tax=Hibiscus sabdariffa TaxID=183260 RepID=A0ABR2EU55_9ROSI